jgi:hypothetical protein
MRERFENGSVELGLQAKKATKIFDLMEHFCRRLQQVALDDLRAAGLPDRLPRRPTIRTTSWRRC